MSKEQTLLIRLKRTAAEPVTVKMKWKPNEGLIGAFFLLGLVLLFFATEFGILFLAGALAAGFFPHRYHCGHCGTRTEAGAHACAGCGGRFAKNRYW